MLLARTLPLLALVATSIASPISGDYNKLDDASTRSDWVTTYKNVDDTSTRSDWVSSYKGIDPLHSGELHHWIPSGPGYLKLDYSPIHREHLITLTASESLMHGTGLNSFIKGIARRLHW